jgi:hypothetical protein
MTAPETDRPQPTMLELAARVAVALERIVGELEFLTMFLENGETVQVAIMPTQDEQAPIAVCGKGFMLAGRPVPELVCTLPAGHEPKTHVHVASQTAWNDDFPPQGLPPTERT